MKKLTIISFLLLCASTLFGQTATPSNTDSAIMAHIDIPGAIAATTALTKYGITQAQITAIINSITTSVANQVNALPFGTAPVTTSTYKFSKPISLSGVSNQVISGDSIICGTVPGISLTNCSNITVTNCKIYNGSGVNAVGILLTNCTNITVNGCFITKVASGVYAVGGSGIVINANQFLNMQGPYPRSQYVQFNGVKGTGNAITNNACESISGQSILEDGISMYNSNGTAASPIIISGNMLRGGGPSISGGGIMLGDAGGSYQQAINNILVSPGQYGCAISGGTNMTISGNKIYSPKTTISNVGIYVWNQYTPQCALNTVSNTNQVNWTNKSGGLSPGWNNGNCGSVAGGWNANLTTSGINASILPVVIITMK